MIIEKQIVEEYLEFFSIKPIGHLAKDIENGNREALRFPAYAITDLNYINILPGIIMELASIQIPVCDREKINKSESRYFNILTELFGAWFVSNKLCMNIKQLELSPKVKIVSPFCVDQQKSCDIMAEDENEKFYFEVKDLSSEILSKYSDPEDSSCEHYTPSLPSKIQKWLRKQINEAIKKGANYLVCRLPVYSSPGIPEFSVQWLKQIFPVEEIISANEYKIRIRNTQPDYFKGVYLIKNRRSLLLKLMQ